MSTHKHLDWKKLNNVLKYGNNPQEEAWRKQEWQILDFNHNDYVSLSEFESWVMHFLPEFFEGDGNQYKMAFRYAFNRARLISKVSKNTAMRKKQLFDDYLTWEEFRPMLKLTRMFLEVYAMFDELDPSGNKKITRDEFLASQKRLLAWGAKQGDFSEYWGQLDKNGSGAIMFDEFLLFALEHDLQHDEDK